MKILKHQFDRIDDYHLDKIMIDESLERKIDCIMKTRGSSTFSDMFLKDMSIEKLLEVLNHLASLREEYKNLLKDVEDLRHFKDSHVGLWGTDKEFLNEELKTFKQHIEKTIKDKHNDKVEELRLRIFHNYSLVDLMLTDNPPEDKNDYAKMLQDEAIKVKYDKGKVLKLIDQIIEY